MATPSQAHSSHVEKANAYQFEDGTTLRLRWPSAPNRRYQIEARGTLTGGDWGAVGPVLTGSESAGETDAVVTVSGAAGYYRVRLVE
jgi:hypothetical protein